MSDHPHTESKLDDSLDDTFPASDPPSMTDPSKGVRQTDEAAEADAHADDSVSKPNTPKMQADLDDALDDTFPASDPPSMTDPSKGVRQEEE